MTDQPKKTHEDYFQDGMRNGIMRQWKAAAEDFRQAQLKAERPDDKHRYHCLVEAMHRIARYH